jgi:hypothetical protein
MERRKKGMKERAQVRERIVSGKHGKNSFMRSSYR